MTFELPTLNDAERERYSALMRKLEPPILVEIPFSFDNTPNIARLSAEERLDYIELSKKRFPCRIEGGEQHPIPDWIRILDDEIAGEPVLVLACQGPPGHLIDRDWYHIWLQTAGFSCAQRNFFALNLPLRDGIKQKLIELEKKYYYSQLDVPWTPLSRILEYRAYIKNLFSDDVDCDSSYRWLQESVYPIDLSQAALSLLTTDDAFFSKLPPHEWFGYNLFVLTANCD